MKRLILVILLVLTATTTAQDQSTSDVAALKAQISDLQQNLDAARSQINALIQRVNGQPPTKEASKAQKKAYFDLCHNHGLLFGSIDINNKTGDIIIHCY